MKHKAYVNMNHDHYAKVVDARRRFIDAEDAKVIQYVETTQDVVNQVNQTFKQKFLEAL